MRSDLSDRQRAPHGTIKAETPLRYLKGVGPRRAESLTKIGVETVEDLLQVLPFRYEDRRAFARVADMVPGGREATLAVRVESARLIRTRRAGFTIFEARLADESGAIVARWYNQPYLAKLLIAGRHAVLFGRPEADRRGGGSVLDNPDYEILDEADAEGIHTGRIVPVYRKLGDLGSRMQRSLAYRSLAALEPGALPERVPPEIAARHALLERREAIRRVHFPAPDTSMDALAERRTPEHRALAFEEIFLLQLALLLRRRGLEAEVRGIAYSVPDDLRARLAALLPFALTGAQKRCSRRSAPISIGTGVPPAAGD